MFRLVTVQRRFHRALEVLKVVEYRVQASPMAHNNRDLDSAPENHVNISIVDFVNFPRNMQGESGESSQYVCRFDCN